MLARTAIPFLSLRGTIAAGCLFFVGLSCHADEIVLAKLSLKDLPVETVLSEERPPGGIPQTLPFAAGTNGEAYVTVESEYASSAGAIGGEEGKILLARKGIDTEPYGIRFEFGELPISSGKLKMELKALFEGKDQRGNIILGFSSANGLISFLQVGDSGVVQLIQSGEQVTPLDFNSIPLSSTIESLTLELDFETGIATVTANGEALGQGTFDAAYAVSAFTINMGGSSEARRTLAIERLTISHHE